MACSSKETNENRKDRRELNDSLASSWVLIITADTGTSPPEISNSTGTSSRIAVYFAVLHGAARFNQFSPKRGKVPKRVAGRNLSNRTSSPEQNKIHPNRLPFRVRKCLVLTPLLAAGHIRHATCANKERGALHLAPEPRIRQ